MFLPVNILNVMARRSARDVVSAFCEHISFQAFTLLKTKE